jgi:hypothetical protein
MLFFALALCDSEKEKMECLFSDGSASTAVQSCIGPNCSPDEVLPVKSKLG